MAYVNIPRDKEDPNYRYKMPKLLSKIEGRGNGIRTNVYNMGEIARALKRPPMYPTKFFGCELGAMVKFEEAEEKALINGAHNEQDLVAILDKFIQMYVLCDGCELPEIDIAVKKGLLVCKCNACGYSGPLDNTHKAATYMAKNPPNATESTLGKKKKTKEERRAEKQASKEADNNNGSGKDSYGKENGSSNKSLSKEYGSKDGKDKTKDKKSKDKKKKRKDDDEQSDDRTPTNEGDGSGEDTTKGSDSERKSDKKKDKKDRNNNNNNNNKSYSELAYKENLTMDSPEIAQVAERLRLLVANSLEKVTPEAFFTELRVLQVSQDFNAKCRIYVVLSALFKDGVTPEGLDLKMPYISKCVDSSVKATDILEALEYICNETDSNSLTNYPYLLQRMYSAELLEADDILNYYKQEGKGPYFEKCKTCAEPFLKWLAEADSSDEEE